MQSFGSTSSKIYEVAARIRELREIAGGNGAAHRGVAGNVPPV